MKNLPVFNSDDFKVSTFCAYWRGCVEVAQKDGIIAVGDTKNPQQQPLYFDQAEWNAFVKGIKNGEFDF